MLIMLELFFYIVFGFCTIVATGIFIGEIASILNKKNINRTLPTKYVNMFENDANNWWYKMYPTVEAAQESLTKSKLPGKVVKVTFEEV